MTVRILIASRNQEVIDFCRGVFADQDCQLITAGDASLALFLANKNFPDLILCDLSLSQQSSIPIIQELRNDADLAHIPLFSFSAGSHSQAKSSSQVPNFIEFPLSAQDLKAALSPYLKAHSDDREPQTPE